MAVTDNYNLIALAFFAVFAIFVPLSFLLTSALLRSKKSRNSVKGTPYESAEMPIGKNKDVINEYLPYFILFLPFEIIAVLLAVWAVAAHSMALGQNLLSVGLAFFAGAFAMIAYRFISDNNV